MCVLGKYENEATELKKKGKKLFRVSHQSVVRIQRRLVKAGKILHEPGDGFQSGKVEAADVVHESLGLLIGHVAWSKIKLISTKVVQRNIK